VSLLRSRTATLSLRAKILGAVGAAVLVSGAAGGFTLLRLHSTTGALESVVHDQGLALQASELRSAFQVQHQKLKDIFLRGSDPASFTKYKGQFGDAAVDVNKRFTVLKSELAKRNDKQINSLLHTFETGYATYNGSFAKAMAAVKTTKGFDASAGDAVMHGLDHPEQIDGSQRFVSASVGISLDGERYEMPGELLRDADVAMYRAKELGRARAAIFDISMRHRAVERLDLEVGLRDVVGRDELELRYQTQVSLDANELRGVEALLRWRHPKLGLLGPERFISLAEQTGLIVPIGEWVLEEACRRLVAWDAPDLRIAVNISPHQLATSARLVDAVAAALERSGLSADRLCLEITETALLVEDAGMMGTPARLKRLGVRLALEDFGVGHASLAHLRELMPIDTLKLDRLFVAGMIDDRKDEAA